MAPKVMKKGHRRDSDGGAKAAGSAMGRGPVLVAGAKLNEKRRRRPTERARADTLTPFSADKAGWWHGQEVVVGEGWSRN